MVIVAITGPWVGARSDGSQGKKPLLFITTLACIISTFLLGTFNVNTSVLLFIISLIGFNLGSVVYDALLISVSNENNRGKFLEWVLLLVIWVINRLWCCNLFTKYRI